MLAGEVSSKQIGCENVGLAAGVSGGFLDVIDLGS